MKSIFILLVIFQLKHFLADFPLQGVYMLGKFKKTGWVLPLAAHASVHALFTFLICAGWGFRYLPLKVVLFLSALDFVVHFSVDRIKASPSLLGRWKPDNKYFWYTLGVDQMAHHLTHYFIIYWILK